MATATLSNDTAPEPTPTAARGLLLPCPKCGEERATITLDLADGESLHCQDCDTDFEVKDVRTFLTKWSALLRWLDAMPATAEGEE